MFEIDLPLVFGTLIHHLAFSTNQQAPKSSTNLLMKSMETKVTPPKKKKKKKKTEHIYI